MVWCTILQLKIMSKINKIMIHNPHNSKRQDKHGRDSGSRYKRNEQPWCERQTDIWDKAIEWQIGIHQSTFVMAIADKQWSSENCSDTVEFNMRMEQNRNNNSKSDWCICFTALVDVHTKCLSNSMMFYRSLFIFHCGFRSSYLLTTANDTL